MPATMQNRWLADEWFTDDDQFNRLYPPLIQKLADHHWTPLQVAKDTADFLVPENGVKVLDIGSRAGKFCWSASNYKPAVLFYVIEQRIEMIGCSREIKSRLALNNLSFMHGNFAQFDHYYFYNSFYENIAGTEKMDDAIGYSLPLYNYYNSPLFNQWEIMPFDIRVATYPTCHSQMSPWYHLAETRMYKLLNFWIKS